MHALIVFLRVFKSLGGTVDVSRARVHLHSLLPLKQACRLPLSQSMMMLNYLVKRH
jgi:hypothetical protein